MEGNPPTASTRTAAMYEINLAEQRGTEGVRGWSAAALGVFALVCAAYFFLVHRFWFVTDDAYISFRYSRNLALGHGLRYNLNEVVPVEGYSNFLWVLIGSVFEYFRLDVARWMPLISALCGVVLLYLVFGLLYSRLKLSLPICGVAVLSVGFYPPFALWSSSGLETMPFALLIYLTFHHLLLAPRGINAIGAIVCGVLLSLIRAEGFAWVVVILVMTALLRWWEGTLRWKPLLVVALGVAVVFGAYFSWRWWYFQSLLPNTVHAKSGLPLRYLRRGMNYVVVYFLTFCTPLLLPVTSALALRFKGLAAGLGVAAMAWAFPAYGVVSTGDFMAMGRFLVPGIAFQAILLAWTLQALARPNGFRCISAVGVGLVVVILGVLPGWDVSIVPDSVRSRFQFRFDVRYDAEQSHSEFGQWRAQCMNADRWVQEGQALRRYADEYLKPNVSIVLGAIGAIGYFSEFTVYDFHGLVTPSVAKRAVQADELMRTPGHDKRVSPRFFLVNEPTILFELALVSADRAELEAWFNTYCQGALRELGVDKTSLYYVPRVIPMGTKSEDGRMRFVGILEKLEARK